MTIVVAVVAAGVAANLLVVCCVPSRLWLLHEDVYLVVADDCLLLSRLSITIIWLLCPSSFFCCVAGHDGVVITVQHRRGNGFWGKHTPMNGMKERPPRTTTASSPSWGIYKAATLNIFTVMIHNAAKSAR